VLFLFVVPFTTFFYASYVFNPIHAGNMTLYVLQVIADAIAITTVGTLWLTILLDLIVPDHRQRDLLYRPEWVRLKHATVDIFIPVSTESFSIIEKTLRQVSSLPYTKKCVYVLDDGGSEKIRNLASTLGVCYFSRKKHERTFAKSGNINFGLRHAKGEFVVIFDADHVPHENFLERLLPFFENDRVALVQTPQHYSNTDHFIPAGTSQAQEIFYTYVQPAKNSYNAAFCVGTNMIFRRKALDAIGGVALRNHSEDIWTTIYLHENGYESVYVNEVLASGRAPENIPAYFRQQNRWARGGFTLFFYKNPLFVTGLTLDQRMQYFFSNIHYFSGFAILIYLLLPIVYLFFDIHPMNLRYSHELLIRYVPYAATVFFLPWFLLGRIRLATISTSIVLFSEYIRAFLSVIGKESYTWIATEGDERVTEKPIMVYIWPHVLFLALAFLAILVGWYNPADFSATILATLWIGVNSYFVFEFLNRGLITKETV